MPGVGKEMLEGNNVLKSWYLDMTNHKLAVLVLCAGAGKAAGGRGAQQGAPGTTRPPPLRLPKTAITHAGIDNGEALTPLLTAGGASAIGDNGEGLTSPSAPPSASGQAAKGPGRPSGHKVPLRRKSSRGGAEGGDTGEQFLLMGTVSLRCSAAWDC